MFDSIMNAYQLQAQDWHCTQPCPLKKGKHYELKATYSRSYDQCPHCQGTQFHKHGTRPRTLQLTEYMGSACYFLIAIVRFKCISCGKVSNAQLPERLVRPGHKNSLLLSKQIIEKLRSKQSIKEAAKDLKISPSHFYRVLDQMPEQEVYTFLPEVLCVDEFKATKDCQGAMAFTAMDGATHEHLFILEDRRVERLVSFFMRFKREVRLKVKFLVTDMNASYEQLIKRCFPNAQLVTDRFHVVQQLTRSFNQLRIQVMKKYERKSPEYRHMKYFWRPLLKNYDALSEKEFYSRSLRKYTNSRAIVEQVISYDEQLYEGWQNLQLALTHFQNKDSVRFFELIESLDTSVLPEFFVKKFKFLLSKRASIQLALEVPYSNGCLEGMNNKVKALKRAAFGFRTFRNLRKRIILMNL